MNVGWRVPIAVAVGGAAGAGARWLAGESFDVEPGAFPTATLIVNLLGCLLIGVAAGRVHRDSLAWALLVTGVLGGFTTMSAFARELNDLVDADRTGLMAVYLGATFTGGLLALLAAERVAEAWPP